MAIYFQDIEHFLLIDFSFHHLTDFDWTQLKCRNIELAVAWDRRHDVIYLQLVQHAIFSDRKLQLSVTPDVSGLCFAFYTHRRKCLLLENMTDIYAVGYFPSNTAAR